VITAPPATADASDAETAPDTAVDETIPIAELVAESVVPAVADAPVPTEQAALAQEPIDATTEDVAGDEA
jgi:hypothetical protein